MKVIIIAANAQKAAIADQLIVGDHLSKVLLTLTSKKLVEEAQALIIYFECKEDLVRLQSILKIYTGVPLKFYFGDKPHKNFQHFYKFEDANKMVLDLSIEFSKLQDSADIIYENVFKKDDEKQVPTVETLLKDLKARDIIEDQCMELFQSDKEPGHKHGNASASSKKKIDPKNVKVDKKRFRKWWTQSKQDNFEFIKYYLVGWMAKQVKDKQIDEKTIKRLRDFRGYQMRRKQIRILKDHYDSTFSLDINGQRASAAGQSADTTAKGAGSKPSQKDNKVEESKVATDAALDAKPHEKAGTEIQVKFTFFPDKNLETMINLQNLHIFNSDDSWISIGFKPKQKDIKTFIDDLDQFEYLDLLKQEQDYGSSIVLDGKKVRLGMQHSDQLDFDVFFSEDQKESLYLIDYMKVMDQEQEQEAQFQFDVSLGNRLIDIIKSDEPLLVSLMEKMSLESSMKIHLKLFRTAFTDIADGEYKEYLEDPELKRKQAEAEAKAAKLQADQEAAEDKPDEVEDPAEQDKNEEGGDDNNEDENEDDYGNENEYGEEGQEDNDDEEEDEEEDDEEINEKKSQFDIENILKSMIPFMLFKWDAKVKMSPDVDEFVEYCNANKDKSPLFKSFNEAFKSNQQEQSKLIRRGTRAEMLAYLIDEMGFEVDLAWKTEYFFMTAKVKSPDLGNVLSSIIKVGLIQ